MLLCCCHWWGRVVILGANYEVLGRYLSLLLQFDRRWRYLESLIGWGTTWNYCWIVRLGFPRPIHLHIVNNAWLVQCTRLQLRRVPMFCGRLIFHGSRPWFLVARGVFYCNYIFQRPNHRWRVGGWFLILVGDSEWSRPVIPCLCPKIGVEIVYCGCTIRKKVVLEGTYFSL